MRFASTAYCLASAKYLTTLDAFFFLLAVSALFAESGGDSRAGSAAFDTAAAN